MGEAEYIARKPGTIHIVIVAVWSAISAVVGWMANSFLTIAIGAVWIFPPTAFAVVGGIWFGLYGVLGATLGSAIANLTGGYPLYAEAFYIWSIIITAVLPMWAFRQFKADPKLRKVRDWIVYIVFGVLINILIESIWGAYSQVLLGFYTMEAYPFFFAVWLIGDIISVLAIGTPLLLVGSKAIMGTRAYVVRWLA